MKATALIVGLMVVGVTTGWSKEVIWDNFYEMASSLEVAQGTPLGSTDAQALKKAGVYFFSLVNGVNSMEIDKKNEADNAKIAMDYFEAASKLDKTDPVIATWRATSTLAYAGASKKLAIKIKYSNMGISHFNLVPTKDRDNLDYLFMRIISYSRIPKSFKNLTDTVKGDADKYMTLYSSLSRNPGVHERLKESVKAMHAYAYFIAKERKIAKEIMLTIDENLFLQEQAEDTTTAKYYFLMKKKLRIK